MSKLGLHIRNIKFEDLDKYSQDKILAVEEQKCQEQLDKEGMVLQEINIKTACLILLDMHFSNDTVTEFLGSFKAKYRSLHREAKEVTENGIRYSTPKMMGWLDQQIHERFPDFPQAFLDNMKGDAQ